MPIQAKCRKCGRSYTVKDELAGKKFRCKECENPVTVPQPAAPFADEPEEKDPWDTGGFADYEDYDDYEDRDDELPPPRTRSVKKKKPAPAKKKRPKKAASSGPGIGSQIVRGIGAVFGFLVVLGIVLRLIGVAGDLGASWSSYTTPDGNVTVQMPGKVKSVPVRQMAAGGQSFGAERRNFACIIVIEPTPPEVRGMSEAQIFDAFKMGAGAIGASNVQRIDFKGRPAVTFNQSSSAPGIKTSAMAFIHKGKIYTLNYAYKGSKGSDEQTFFNSVEFR